MIRTDISDAENRRRLNELYPPGCFLKCHSLWPNIVMDLAGLLLRAVDAGPDIGLQSKVTFQEWADKVLPGQVVHDMLAEVGQRYDATLQEVAQAFRVAMTGEGSGLPLASIIYLLGRHEVGSRTVYVCTWHCLPGYWPTIGEPADDPN